MPLKASIGLSRKVGQPDYGSLGANCQLEVELDASLIEDGDAFQNKIRRLYGLANQAVNDQLAQQANGGASSPSNGQSNPQSANGNGETPASTQQIKYLLDMARQRRQMDIAQASELCAELVGTNDVYQLTKRQASTVIDRLNGKNGNGRG